MENKKDKLKKALGITEYPWSSDDDDNENLTLIHEASQISRMEPRTSVDDLPGTSGINSVQTSSESTPPALGRTRLRVQTKRDRDFYWSLINNTPDKRFYRTLNELTAADQSMDELRVDLNGTPGVSRSRFDPVPTSSYSMPRVCTGAAPSSLRSLSTTTQNSPRTGSSAGHVLPSFAGNISVRSNIRRPHFWSTYTSAARSHSRPSAGRTGPVLSLIRSPSNNHDSTPGTDHTSTNETPMSRTIPFSSLFRGNQAGEPSPISDRDAYHRMLRQSTTGLPPTRESRSMRYHFKISVPVSTPDNQTQDTSVDSNQNPTDSRIDTSQPDSRPELLPAGVPKTEPQVQSIENLVEGTIILREGDSSTNNASTSSGTGEASGIVETVDGIGNVSGAVTGNEQTNNTGVVNNTDKASLANIGVLSEEPGPSQQQGVKRKREPAGVSAAELNQSLLRLLECPVCLEWVEPPVAQCRRGHLACGACRARLAACPVCRALFSSVRNRALEAVAELLRYPCRHACGRAPRRARRAAHEASCPARRYRCPAPACRARAALPREALPRHFLADHLALLKRGAAHGFSVCVDAERHDTWLVMALDRYFHLQVDVNIAAWGVIVYVDYVGPKNEASRYNYEVTIQGQHNSRKLVYTRNTHSDLENTSENVNRQDCFHLTVDQALNFLRVNKRHCEPEKFLDFDVKITKSEESPKESEEDSD